MFLAHGHLYLLKVNTFEARTVFSLTTSCQCTLTQLTNIMLSIPDKHLWSSAVMVKEPLTYKTRELDRHIPPLFSSVRYHVVQNYIVQSPRRG